MNERCRDGWHVWDGNRAIGHLCQCGALVWTAEGARIPEFVGAPFGLTLAEARANLFIAWADVFQTLRACWPVWQMFRLARWLLDRIEGVMERRQR